MRLSINAPLSEKGIEKLVGRCKRLSKNNIALEKNLLEAAIINNWKNVYLPKAEEIEAVNDVATAERKAFYGI